MNLSTEEYPGSANVSAQRPFHFFTSRFLGAWLKMIALHYTELHLAFRPDTEAFSNLFGDCYPAAPLSYQPFLSRPAWCCTLRSAMAMSSMSCFSPSSTFWLSQTASRVTWLFTGQWFLSRHRSSSCFV
jgi:hypothetical protein